MNPTTILVTDDDEDDRFFLRQAIERQINRATVIEASNGEEALRSLTGSSTAGNINLVILDINMPGINGLDVLDEIRSDSALVHIPTIMLSTSSESSLISTAYAKGANSYIKKPNRIEQYDRIAEAIMVCFLSAQIY